MKALLLLFVMILNPLSAKDLLDLSQVPPAPSDGVYDPEEWLTEDSYTEITSSIRIAKLKWQAEVFVLIFPESPESQDAIFAKKIAEQWGSGKLWGVVMYVIGDAKAPTFFAGRKDSFGWSKEQ